MAVLEDYTLADLVAPRARLANLLGVTAARRPEHTAPH
jgi:hypothetical protein